MLAQTPYYAVIFTSLLQNESKGYAEMAEQMEALAKTQDGYLGFESSRNERGISISYWVSLESIRHWKEQTDHLFAQQLGRSSWYRYYNVRICKVEREYEFGEKE